MNNIFETTYDCNGRSIISNNHRTVSKMKRKSNKI